VSDFDEGLAVTTEILDREGAGHSVAVHTDNREKAVAAGRDLDVCRMVVNQPNLASSGTVTNGLTHSLSMGGGTWAGNQLAENLSYRQFIQTTRVAFRTDAEEPSDAAVFGSFVEDDPGGAAGRHNS
jgi:sulfoacetaldehyde dehydrogenase